MPHPCWLYIRHCIQINKASSFIMVFDVDGWEKYGWVHAHETHGKGVLLDLDR